MEKLEVENQRLKSELSEKCFSVAELQIKITNLEEKIDDLNDLIEERENAILKICDTVEDIRNKLE